MNERYRTFKILAEEKSFTQAAKKLFCSQPTVTQHIQQLENELQCQLIVRNKRQIQLTTQGEIVLLYLHKIQSLEQTMQQELVKEAQKNIPLYISQYIAGYYFEELFMQCPMNKAQYDVISYCYHELKQFLQEGVAKFTIMPIYDGDEEIVKLYDIDILFEEELMLVMNKDHPLAHRQVIYARDLQHHTILLPSSHYLKELIIGKITDKNIDVHFVQMTNFEIIKKAVQQQYGLAFLPEKVLEESKEQFVCKAIKGLKMKRKNGIVYNPNAVLKEEERLFCEHVKHVFKQSYQATDIKHMLYI